jgi:hypothetical protein
MNPWRIGLTLAIYGLACVAVAFVAVAAGVLVADAASSATGYHDIVMAIVVGVVVVAGGLGVARVVPRLLSGLRPTRPFDDRSTTSNPGRAQRRIA